MKREQYIKDRTELSEFLQRKLKDSSIFVDKIQYGISNSQVTIYLKGDQNDPRNILKVNLDFELIPGHTNVYSPKVLDAIKRSIYK